MKQHNLAVILGPTASGKTRLAARLAFESHGEIISGDSRQVYRELCIGAGKDLGEYQVQGTAIPYHLIDIADLSQEFDLFQYQTRFFEVWADIQSRGKLPILVGGTGMYLDAVLSGYALREVPLDIELRKSVEHLSDQTLTEMLKTLKTRMHNRSDLHTRERIIRAIEIARYDTRQPAPKLPVITPLIIGINWERPVLRERIALRLRQRLADGMIQEVREIQQQGVSWERLERLGLEYKHIAWFLQGKYQSQEEMSGRLYLAICDFAKRQMTWFRRMERQGHSIHWLTDDQWEGVAAFFRDHGLAGRIIK